MKKPTISIIAALGKDTRVIGSNGKIPWHIPEDFKRFKALTMGHVIIMGRKTYESIGKPLPGRINIIISRNPDFKAPTECIIAHSLTEALEVARKIEKDEIFIIGGQSVYEEALPLADKLYLTLVETKVGGDTFFPDYTSFTKIIKKIKNNPSNELSYTFIELEK